MARKAQVAVVKRKTPTNDADLRRWCIEMAMRWPMVSNGGMGAAGAYGGMPRVESEANIIDRANRILNWVKGAA